MSVEGDIDYKKEDDQQTVSGQIEHVVSSELREYKIDYVEKLEVYTDKCEFYARSMIAAMKGDSNLTLIYLVTEFKKCSDEMEEHKSNYGYTVEDE